MGGNYCIAHFMGYIALSFKAGKTFCLFLTLCFFACSPNNPDKPTTELPLEAKTPQRIITLAPHLTELLFSLGLEKKIIATVEFSDFPAAAKTIPRIGDAFRIDWEKLALLKPDLILAWEGGNPENLINELQRRNYHVVKLSNASLINLPEQIKELGELFNVSTSGISQNYSMGLEKLTSMYAKKEPVNVFYQISAQPIYSIGNDHTISEMLLVCGAKNIFSDQAILSSPLSPEAVIAANPDVVLTSNFAYKEVVSSWSKLGIIKQENILKISGDEVSRASLRMLQGVKNICEALDGWRQKNKIPNESLLELSH